MCYLSIYEISGVAVREEIAVLANCKSTKGEKPDFIFCCVIKIPPQCYIKCKLNQVQFTKYIYLKLLFLIGSRYIE